jgi:predicted double-glycine peptidase
MPGKCIKAAIAMAALCACVAASAAGTANLWLDVPFVAQQKDGCGAASIAMVMQYWERQNGETERRQADPGEIMRALYSQSAHGIYASAMERYFQSNGFKAFAFAGDWMDLERQLRFGRPIIVALKPDSANELHYVVVAGLDEPEQLVLLNDPAQRKLLKEDRSQFQHEWEAAQHWTLLAVPDTSKH